MITIRGKTVVVKPLTATQIGEVLESVRELGKCTPTIRVLEADKVPHLLRVIAVSIRPEFPGAKLDDLVEELKDALTMDLDVLTPILQALSETRSPAETLFILKETGHVGKC
jgi:hypothetical protein